jgi:hypothetical protein
MPSREPWPLCLVIYITFVLYVCGELLRVLVSVCGQFVIVILWICITCYMCCVHILQYILSLRKYCTGSLLPKASTIYMNQYIYDRVQSYTVHSSPSDNSYCSDDKSELLHPSTSAHTLSRISKKQNRA